METLHQSSAWQLLPFHILTNLHTGRISLQELQLSYLMPSEPRLSKARNEAFVVVLKPHTRNGKAAHFFLASLTFRKELHSLNQGFCGHLADGDVRGIQDKNAVPWGWCLTWVTWPLLEGFRLPLLLARSRPAFPFGGCSS